MSRQIEAPKFRGGQLFKNHALWLRLLEDNRQARGHLQPTAKSFIKAGIIDVDHSSIFNAGKENYSFPHKATKGVTFKNFSHQQEFFRNMTESMRNYKHMKENPAKFQIQSVYIAQTLFFG